MTDLERIEAVLKDYREIFEDIDKEAPQFSYGAMTVIDGIERAITRIKNETKEDVNHD